MNILIAADSFKGSCSARQVTDTIERAAKNVIPDVTVQKFLSPTAEKEPVDALIAAMHGTKSPSRFMIHSAVRSLPSTGFCRTAAL